MTPANLETLLNGLLQQTEKQPYSFFVEEQQLDDELGLFLQAKKVDIQSLTKKTFAPHVPLDSQAKPCALSSGVIEMMD